jgi:hypothetical protein
MARPRLAQGRSERGCAPDRSSYSVAVLRSSSGDLPNSAVTLANEEPRPPPPRERSKHARGASESAARPEQRTRSATSATYRAASNARGNLRRRHEHVLRPRMDPHPCGRHVAVRIVRHRPAKQPSGGRRLHWRDDQNLLCAHRASLSIASEKRMVAAADSADDRGPFSRLCDRAGEEHRDPRRAAAHRAKEQRLMARRRRHTGRRSSVGNAAGVRAVSQAQVSAHALKRPSGRR